MPDTNDIHRLLVEIAGDVGETKGKVESCLDELRSERMRTSSMEIAHNERFEKHDRRIGELEGLRQRTQGATDHRTMLGHLTTGLLAAGAAIAAMWSGVFHAPH